MLPKKRAHPKIKDKLHPRNKHRERYHFKELTATCPELASFIILNKYDDQTIDYANLEAVKMLNLALLKRYYGIESWDTPPGYLVPPIPGRADYIHHVADLLRNNNFGKIPKGDKIICLDTGVGANCIYPILGVSEYGWSFIGSDIDKMAIESANRIIELNPTLIRKTECRLQKNPKDFFYGVIRKDEIIDLTICNPPFHSSMAEASAAANKKLRNLNNKSKVESVLHFCGQSNELWYEGGEERFIRNMIKQSKKFSESCFWFTSLVSKQSSLRSVYKSLDKFEANQVETIPMGQGNKTSRIVAWTFLSKDEQFQWKKARWDEKK